MSALRAWARLEDVSIPSWPARLQYAEAFGVEPHLVNPPLLWWRRWATWRDATASREAHERARSNPDWGASMSADERRVILWAARD